MVCNNSAYLHIVPCPLYDPETPEIARNLYNVESSGRDGAPVPLGRRAALSQG